MDGILIRTLKLGKTYVMGESSIHALAEVDLEVQRGSFVAFIGPSGSGKSTLLNLIGGLDNPTTGSILVDGARLEVMDENALAAYRRRKVGFIFQSFNLIPSMTAMENVAFPMRFTRVPRSKRLALACELLEQVGLGDRIHHLPSELSGGEQQRVAVARSMVNNPELVLADEPTGNLDSHIGAQILHLLAALQDEGRTVLVVSHDQRIQHFADTITYMLDGRIVSEADHNAALAFVPTEEDL